MPGNPVAEEAVRNVLLGVMDPELGDNIVDLGMVQVIEIDPQSGDVDVTTALTTAGCPLRGPDVGHQAARVEMVTCTARQFFKTAGLLTPMPAPRPTATSQTGPKDNDKEPLPR